MLFSLTLKLMTLSDVLSNTIGDAVWTEGFYSVLSLKAMNSHRPMMQQEMSKNFVLSNSVIDWFVLKPFLLNSNSSFCFGFGLFYVLSYA